MSHQERTTPVEIGKLIQSERKRQGLTQFQLAAMAGTGIRLISDIENGKGTVQIQKLLTIIQTLGLGVFIFSPYENS